MMAFLCSKNSMTILHILSPSGGNTLQTMNAARLSVAIVCLCTCLVLTDSAHLRAEGTPISRDSSENLTPQDELARRATWSQPSETENTKRLQKWLSDQTKTSQEKATLATTTPRKGMDALDYLMQVICAVEKQHQGLLTDISSMPPIEIIRLTEKLNRTENDTFAIETIRLWTALPV